MAPLDPADLLQVWRDAVEATERAERLTRAATEAARQADARLAVADDLAELAHRAAAAARRTEQSAGTAAFEAAAVAESLRQEALRSDQERLASRDAESHVADEYFRSTHLPEAERDGVATVGQERSRVRGDVTDA